jgi:succinyl-CoA synthetase beta subunit
VDVPIIVRLTGTNADKAFTMVDEFAKKNADRVKIIV